MDLGVLMIAAGVSAAGGLFPWITAEVAVLGAALVTPAAGFPALVLASTLGQMSGKSVLYGLTRWAPDRLPRRARALLAKADRFAEHRVLLGAAVFSGSLASVPPFFLITVACGTLRVPFPVFVLAGLAGTAIRYGLVLWVAVALGAGG